jgi:plasmid segregation protein ParM
MNKYFENNKDYLEELNVDFKNHGLPQVDFIPLAIDDGYSQNNIAYWIVKDGELSIGENKIMSRGKRGRHLQQFGGGDVAIYQTDNDEYTVSNNLGDPEDTRSADYSKTPLNRFLVHASMNELGLKDGIEVGLITGLPIGQYQRKIEGVNKKLIQAKTKNMMVPVTFGTKRNQSAKVVYHTVLPEAICGLVDWMIGIDGKPLQDPNVTRMVIDIGGKTTDMAVVMPGNEVAEVSTVDFGTTHIKDRLKILLEDKLECAVDSIILDEALANKEVNLFGEGMIDVSGEWDIAVDHVLTEIFHAADNFRKKHPSLKEVIGLGGGMALCEKNVQEKYKTIKVVPNPDGANARGALKFATFGLLEDIMAEMKSPKAEQING